MSAENAGITEVLARILATRAAELGLSLRDIQERSGVPHSTVGRILEAKTAISLDKFEAIARALGLTPWRVMREAEDRLAASPAPSAAVHTADPAATYAAVAEAKLRAVLQSNYTPAARHHEPNPYEGVGEENQDVEGE